MMRVADYIANFVHDLGVRDVFMVTGGGAMFLSDAVAMHKGLKGICNHHEQASAMAAFAYSKYTGKWGSAFFTTGCGATNGITGLLDAWQDNIPVLYVSGQVKRKETTFNSGLPLRQFGVQEANIIPVVESLTKFAVMINEPEKIRYYLEKAAFLATHGRPGPVWIDVPLDVQGALVDEKNLIGFDSSELTPEYKVEATKEELEKVKTMLREAKRPVILAGHGVRLAGALQEFKHFAESYQLPVVGTYLAIDFLPYDHPLFIGRAGLKGDRAGNLALQNSDLIINLGSRLGVTVTGYEYGLFAREAKIIVIDIDPKEHQKNTVKIDTFINADVKQFLTGMLPGIASGSIEWRNRCLDWRNRYPVCLPEYSTDPAAPINLYYFTERLSRQLKPKAVVIGDAGSAIYVPAQGLLLKDGQRFIAPGGQAEMGFTLPACIGVSAAMNGGEVIGITGDGSFQSNLQELQTVVQYKLPIKIFVWNNDGYLSIRATQKKFFEGREIGTDSTNGVSFPDLEKIAYAYGIKYVKIPDNQSLDKGLQEVLDHQGPVLCEVMCLREQEVIPTVSSKKLPDGRMVSKPLEDMYPFLDRKEFLGNMIVKPIEE